MTEPKALKVGILGATGAVGEQMMIVLAERNFPVAELRLFGSARSAGTKLAFKGKDYVVEEASLERMKGLDLLLGAADNDVAKKFLPDAAKLGVTVVDNSSAFRLDPEVPLFIPEVKPEDVKWSKGLFANPNCATIFGLTAIAPLHRRAKVKRLIASTYQAVSGAGKGGIDEADAVQFAQWLVEDGVDMFHVAQANHTGNMADTIPPMGVQPYGFFVKIAGDIKKAVNVPVSAVGRIVDAEMAERVIESGMADMVAMGRPLLADPDWGTKIAAGKACDIRRCISCNKGCTDAIQNRQFLSCVLNAENGYENTRSIQPAAQKKKIAVLGGGPAGLEAARVAALRGHDGTLIEKTTTLGGQLNIACVPPRKEEMRRAAQDLIHAVCNAGVHLCMGQTRTAEQLKDAGFEAVINAVGAHSAAPRIPGIDSVNVADAWKVLAGEQQVYGTVAVIGGGMVGCETAEYLAARGCKVSVIEMMDKIAAGESTTILPTLLENYKTYGVEQYPSHKVKEFRMDAVVCENKDGAEVTIPCDYIVLAMGARSNEFDAAALEAAGIPVYSIGDAAGKAADISNAIRTGYDTACQL